MSKEIQKYEPNSFAIATMEVEELKQTVEDNLGGDKLSEWDMERWIMPSGKGMTFTVETASSSRPETELVGVIVFQQSRRAWWEKDADEGESGPPDCQSSDGVHGVGKMAEKAGGLCANCPKSKFGSAVDKSGNPAKGQACAQKKCLFVMQKDAILPCVLMVPPTSLTNLKQYLAALISARKPYFGVVTKIKLKAQKSAAGKDYGELTFEIVEKIDDPKTVEKFKKAGEFFSKSLGSSQAVAVTTGATNVQAKPMANVVDVEAKVVDEHPEPEDYNDKVARAADRAKPAPEANVPDTASVPEERRASKFPNKQRPSGFNPGE